MFGLGIGELLILGVCFAFGAGVIGVGAFFLMRRGGSKSGSREGVLPSAAAAPALAPPPVSREPAFFLRLEGESAELMRAAAARLAPNGTLTDTTTRDAALELMRAIVDATHAWVGPAPSTLAADSPMPGGLVVALTARVARPVDTVLDDSQGIHLRTALSTLASLPDSELLGGRLAILPSEPTQGAPTLVPLDAGALPQSRLCTYCRNAMRVWDTRCPTCGAASDQ